MIPRTHISWMFSSSIFLISCLKRWQSSIKWMDWKNKPKNIEQLLKQFAAGWKDSNLLRVSPVKIECKTEVLQETKTYHRHIQDIFNWHTRENGKMDNGRNRTIKFILKFYCLILGIVWSLILSQWSNENIFIWINYVHALCVNCKFCTTKYLLPRFYVGLISCGIDLMWDWNGNF